MRNSVVRMSVVSVLLLVGSLTVPSSASAGLIGVWSFDGDATDRGGPHPLDRFSSQLRWNPIHDSSCFVCWLSSSPSVSVRFLRRPAVERRVGPAPVVHPQADSSPGLGASSELGQVDALVFE